MSIFRKCKKDEITKPKKKLQKKGENCEEKSKELLPKTVKQKNHRKEKNDTYILKKDLSMKIFRWVFWFMLLSIFARGVYQIVKPQKASELKQIIAGFKQDQESIGDAPDEVMSFAQDFAKEYLSYEKGGEQDFKNRISPYISKRLSNIPSLYSFRNSAKAVYVNAYRREEDNGLYSVYVNAEIQYDKGEEGMEDADCTLKIPVAATESGFCVAALPMYVQDERLDKNYSQPQVQLGQEIDTTLMLPAVENFLSAYYTQDQSMINYLLTADADHSKFLAMKGRYKLAKVETIKAYQKEGSPDITCVLSVRITDTINTEEISQEYKLTLIQEGDKYYIKDMDTTIY